MDLNIKSDLSTLTTINESVFTKLMNKVEWCISDGLEKALLSGDNQLNIDFDIGTLIINLSNDEIRYKFKPSPNFEKVVTDTVVNEHNSLTMNMEESLVTKLTNVYKTFF